MADFVIQFRFSRPEHANTFLGDVIAVYTPDQIKEPPSLSGHTAWIIVAGVPNNQTLQSMRQLLTDTGEVADGPNAYVRFNDLPTPYKEDVLTNRESVIPFGVAVAFLFHRPLGRNMQSGDFQ